MNIEILNKMIEDMDKAKEYITEGVTSYLNHLKEGLEIIREEHASITILLFFLTIYYGENGSLKIPKQYYELHSETPFRLEISADDEWLYIKSIQEE